MTKKRKTVDGKKPRYRKTAKNHWARWTAGGVIAIMLLTVLAGAQLQRLLAKRPWLSKPLAEVFNPITFKLTPTFEIFPQEPEPLPPKPEPPRAAPPAPAPAKPPIPSSPDIHRPKIAIVIDDLGYDLSMARKFIQLDIPMSLAIFPNGPFQQKISRMARQAGVETLMHLPMEPIEFPRISPGPGALLAGMGNKETAQLLAAHLDAIPGIRGVNNHMGSRLTAMPDPMRVIFTELKKRGLFFLDSRTTPESCTRSVAGQVGIPFATRHIFIDHTPSPEIIRTQLKKLVTLALRHGQAIGIGHPYAATYTELSRMLPHIRSHATLVPVSTLVSIPAG